MEFLLGFAGFLAHVITVSVGLSKVQFVYSDVRGKSSCHSSLVKTLVLGQLLVGRTSWTSGDAVVPLQYSITVIGLSRYHFREVRRHVGFGRTEFYYLLMEEQSARDLVHAGMKGVFGPAMEGART